MIFGNKIDELVKEQEKLILKKQKIEDKKNNKCAKLGIERKKHEDAMQRIENKTLVLENQSKVEIAEINRRIKKTKKQIKLEQEYYFSLTEEEPKKKA